MCSVSSKPLVSVVLPVYNCEKYIALAVQSILSQSINNIEFIIVDDASNDDTNKILSNIKKSDNRIHLIVNQQNLRQTESITIACKRAKGEYIAVMNADDIALPTRLEKQVQFLDQNSDYGMVGSWVDAIDRDGNVLEQWKTASSHEELMWDMMFGAGFAHSSVMMRNSLVKKVGYYTTIQSEDYDLWRRLSRISKVANLPEVLLQKRVWSGQLANRVVAKNLECHLNIMQDNIQYLLNDDSIDLELIKILFSVIDDKVTPEMRNSNFAKESVNLMYRIHNQFIKTYELSSATMKYVDVNTFQIIHSILQIDKSNIENKIIAKIKLFLKFPRLSIYKLFKNKK